MPKRHHSHYKHGAGRPSRGSLVHTTARTLDEALAILAALKAYKRPSGRVDRMEKRAVKRAAITLPVMPWDMPTQEGEK